MKDRPAGRPGVVLGIVAAVSLLLFLGTLPCQRSQEARVLVTAREMLQDGGERWLLPTCNGQLRLAKPPLTYWASAISYQITGVVAEFSGRLPSVLWTWTVVMLTYAAGRRWFSPRVGLLGAAMLLTCHVFYRYGRLAETDIAATCFVTAAVCAIWRGVDIEKGGKAIGWFVLGGLAMGLALMAKGVPGVYPLLFLVFYAMTRRGWRRLLTGLVTVAVPAALIGAPWYLYIKLSGHWPVLSQELRIVVEGEDHPGGLFTMLQHLFRVTLPWVAFWPAALVFVGWRLAQVWRTAGSGDRFAALLSKAKGHPLLGLACWLLATLLPIALSGNKQFHYLLPSMPAVMLLSAWVVDRGLRESAPAPLARFVRMVIVVTVWVGIVGGLCLLIWAGLMAAGRVEAGSGRMAQATAILSGLLMATGLLSLWARRKRGLEASLVASCAGLCLVLPWMVGPWAVTLESSTIRDVAGQIQARVGNREVISYGRPAELPMAFQLRRVIPFAQDEAELANRMSRNPEAAVIVETEPKEPEAQVPSPLKRVWSGGPEGKHYQFFEAP